MMLKPKDVRVPHATDTQLPLAHLRLRGGAYQGQLVLGTFKIA